MGILLAKMIFGNNFENFGGDWDVFNFILEHRSRSLKARLLKPGSGVSEETHHISLACELVEACLQQKPEDRQVAVSYNISCR